jgi:hypothetical protein
MQVLGGIELKRRLVSILESAVIAFIGNFLDQMRRTVLDIEKNGVLRSNSSVLIEGLFRHLRMQSDQDMLCGLAEWAVRAVL